MTILHVAAPGVAGGLESVVLELAGGLTNAGHRVALAAVLDPDSANHPVADRATGLGVEVFRLVVPSRAYLLEFRQIRHLVRELRPDVVHTHGYRADLIGGLAAQRSGVPWVATAHGFAGGDQKNRLYEWLQIRAYRRAQAVIAVSEPIQRRLAKEGVAPDRIHVLRNAWAPKQLLSREVARRRLGIEGVEASIGWVGRLSREKGADVFLEALARLPHRRWTASIIGDGGERPALELQAQALGIADRIRWHGLLPDASGLYRAFDVWVLSSRTEGTPIALFEAMSARVPAVVTAVGGVPDVVTEAEATLVPAEQPAALAAALAGILADPEAAAVRAEAAHRRLVTDFAPPDWLAGHVALYRAIRYTTRPED